MVRRARRTGPDGPDPDADDAFAELIRRHRPAIVRFVVRRTGSTALGDEIAAEVVEQAWRSIGTLDDPERFVPWLMRATARRLVDRYRSDGRRRRRELRADRAVEPLRASGDPAEIVDFGGGPDADTLRHALGQLSATHQEVIMLRFHADLTPADAAQALGVTPSAAGVRLHRAIAALRQELAGHAPTGDAGLHDASAGEGRSDEARSRHDR